MIVWLNGKPLSPHVCGSSNGTVLSAGLCNTALENEEDCWVSSMPRSWLIPVLLWTHYSVHCWCSSNSDSSSYGAISLPHMDSKKMQSWIPDAAIWFSSCLRVPVLWDLFIQIFNSWVKRRGKNVNRLITLDLLYSHCSLQFWVELNDANEEYICLLPITSLYWLFTCIYVTEDFEHFPKNIHS